jgi:hypothetical protein
MGKLAEWLRHVAGILTGKAELMEKLDERTRAELSWLTWRRTIVGTAAGFLAGYIARGL